ncbi:MAG: hypothetical protein A3G45_00750 [Candidatus Staskawiczbacteria bacterium RIFCSPLOWO2_12_FULL_37_15]|uniref:Uncharacterized protein n=1 Tax=Candidatus Staskawiczbacteria bacterium RIFCSPLOWO2_12_FULL_37_15 TaxID=1802218 RepID=A0A1G2IR21_9BACT|nr:MAG: hypothetical protein A3G45_00750 [Candidatus Staskawiczbacteria bacterium RIFCSPLOWO2_12_FULL_37_15]
MFLGTPFLTLLSFGREFSRTRHDGLLAAGIALLFGPENLDARADGRLIKTGRSRRFPSEPKRR